MDYINYIKQSPYRGFTGYGGGVAGFGFLSGGMTPEALVGGGQGTLGPSIQAVNIDTTGNATSYGTLGNPAVWSQAACSNGTDRGLWGGGTGPWGGTDNIHYIGFNDPQSTSTFGDLTANRSGTAAAANDTRGIWYGAGSQPQMSTMDYVTIDTTGNASNFGNIGYNAEFSSGLANATRALFAGGQGPGSPPFTSFARSAIKYVTIASTGDASDFGNLTRQKKYLGGMASSTRGVWGGGFYNSGPGGASSHVVDEMDYVTISSGNTAGDFGNLTSDRAWNSGASNEDRGILFGGFDNTVWFNSIEYITIASLGNATDFGDLASSKTYANGGSCAGGGLGA